VREWLNRAVSKTVVRATVPRVRIPPPPPQSSRGDQRSARNAARSSLANNSGTSQRRSGRVSEDFGLFGQEWKVPSLFWYVGGTDPGVYHRAAQTGRIAQDVPTNHSSKFAPVLRPTLETGIQTLATASLSYLGGKDR
jgi:metal-dependent amidase/aminoacylase/carboxypeptidase family protein